MAIFSSSLTSQDSWSKKGIICRNGVSFLFSYQDSFLRTQDAGKNTKCKFLENQIQTIFGGGLKKDSYPISRDAVDMLLRLYNTVWNCCVHAGYWHFLLHPHRNAYQHFPVTKFVCRDVVALHPDIAIASKSSFVARLRHPYSCTSDAYVVTVTTHLDKLPISGHINSNLMPCKQQWGHFA